MTAVVERFLEKANVSEDGCWEWRGSKYRNGYGRFSLGDKWRSAHRVAYELFVGSIPDRLFVLHKCDNKACVRPDHLFLGTQADNMTDMKVKGRSNGGPPFGEGNGKAKLNETQVRHIFLECKLRKANRKQLADKYGVSRSAIRDIATGKSWTSVSEKCLAELVA